MDKAVKRIKALPRNYNARDATVTEMRCRFCPFKTKRLTRAWAHSMVHGPWPEEEGGSKGYFAERQRPPIPYRHERTA